MLSHHKSLASYTRLHREKLHEVSRLEVRVREGVILKYDKQMKTSEK